MWHVQDILVATSAHSKVVFLWCVLGKHKPAHVYMEYRLVLLYATNLHAKIHYVLFQAIHSTYSMINFHLPHGLLFQIPLVITARDTRCHSYLLCEFKQWPWRWLRGNIFRRWLISVKTLPLSVTCRTQHLKALQLSREAATAAVKVKWCDKLWQGPYHVLTWHMPDRTVFTCPSSPSLIFAVSYLIRSAFLLHLCAHYDWSEASTDHHIPGRPMEWVELPRVIILYLKVTFLMVRLLTRLVKMIRFFCFTTIESPFKEAFCHTLKSS